jgi:hypothetical protein
MVTQEDMIAHARTLEQMRDELVEDGRFELLTHLVGMAADVAYETCGSFATDEARQAGQAPYDFGGYDPSQ